MIKFELDAELLTQFRQAAVKILGKAPYIFIKQTLTELRFEAQDSGRWVRLELPVVSKSEFAFGIESTRFFIFIQKVKSEFVSFSLNKQLSIKSDSLTLKFPLVNWVGVSIPLEGTKFDISSEFLRGLSLCGSIGSAIAADTRFAGVLLDAHTDHVRISKFSGTAIAVSSHELVVSGRCVVSEAIADLAATSLDFKKALQSPKAFTMFTDFGLMAGSACYTDTYPDIPEQLGFNQGVNLLVDKKGYKFVVAELYAALVHLKSLVGAEGGAVMFKQLGSSGELGDLVFGLKVSTTSGFTADTKLFCTGEHAVNYPEFNVHLNQFVKVLSTFLKEFDPEFVYCLPEEGVLRVFDDSMRRVLLFSTMR